MVLGNKADKSEDIYVALSSKPTTIPPAFPNRIPIISSGFDIDIAKIEELPLITFFNFETALSKFSPFFIS